MADKPLTEPAEGSPAESSSEPSLSADAVAELQRERDDFHDRWLRKSAEFDNYRKRVDRERREQPLWITDLLKSCCSLSPISTAR
jgi:molecular chaperone GrpE